MTVVQRLSFAVRFVDHFSGEAPAVDFPVRLAGGAGLPVRRPGGGARQEDGSYRFQGLPDGPARVLWRHPFERSHAGWTRWDPDLEVRLPLATPGVAVAVAVWPTAEAVAPPGATGVRGKLVGAGLAGLTVRIARQGNAFDRFTRSDELGQFLFLPPGTLAPNAAGRVPLTIEVLTPSGSARPVVGGTFVPASAGGPFAGAAFAVRPGTVSRILFELA